MSPLQGAPDNTDTEIPAASADAAFMDAEIRLVARFYTLTFWRICTSVLLCAFMMMCAFFGINAASALYILLFLNLLPFLLDELCASYVKKSVPVLPYLRKQYHYSSLRYMTMNITFFATNFLLVLWQFHNSAPAYPAAWLYNSPAFLLALGFFLRAVTPHLAAKHIRKKMGFQNL